jgi:prepilin-type N-terminal cleavage/methylation domain-containing protein
MQNKKRYFLSIASNRFERGFTLLELLVVISIIGILAGLLFVSFTTVQRRTRDAQRKSDLRQYQTSLEAYGNLHDGYYVWDGNVNASTTLCSQLALSTCPDDPKAANGFHYYYFSYGGTSPNALDYVLWTVIEGPPSTYWVVCSNGKSGTANTVNYTTCPL